MTIRRVLIYRLGSLGDTIVALPAFHLVARAYPDAERIVLTNAPSDDKAPPLKSILEGTGLVHGYFFYPLKLRNPIQINKLRRHIKQWAPDVLIYLAEPRGRMKAFRDAFFFKSCGIVTMIGVPLKKAFQENQWMEDKQSFESETKRILRCLSSLGNVNLEEPGTWNLGLAEREQACAIRALQPIDSCTRIIACSVGSRVDVKNWGQDNWVGLFKGLYQKYADCGLVFIGSKDEFSYSETIGRPWLGRKINLCGKLTPRESAQILRKAAIFVSHDSGPMHLAASVGTTCVAIFSGQSKAGIWFPYGKKHKIIYHKTSCSGCGLEICEKYKKECINSITVKEVIKAIDDSLSN